MTERCNRNPPVCRRSLSPQKKHPQRAGEEPLDKREAALAAQRVHNGDFTDFSLPLAISLDQSKKGGSKSS